MEHKQISKLSPLKNDIGHFLKFPPSVASKLRDSLAGVIVTGAGGWIGQATLEMLDQLLLDDFDRLVVGVAAHPRSIKLRSGRICKLVDFDNISFPRVSKIIVAHFAFHTRERISDFTPEDYIKANREITRKVSGLVRDPRMLGVLSTSSGAVYEAGRKLATNIETNPYGVLKLEEEQTLYGLAKKNNFNLSLCRIFNISGPFIHKKVFALNSILASALEGRDIQLTAKGRVFRDYFHVRDLISLGFSIALDGGIVEPYDGGLGLPIEIGELASLALQVLERENLKINRPEITLSDNIYYGEAAAIRNLFSAHSITPASYEAQILDTARYLEVYPIRA